MTKSKNHHSELDQLREELRNSKSTIKHLQKELARATRGLHRLDDLEELLKDEGTVEIGLTSDTAKRCSECRAVEGFVGGKMKIIHKADCPQRKKK
jgi:chromosome segregation ATPase